MNWGSFNWEDIGKLLNSRMGLALLIVFYTSSPWGLGARIASIEQLLQLAILRMDVGDKMDAIDHELLIRMEERQRLGCNHKELAKK